MRVSTGILVVALLVLGGGAIVLVGAMLLDEPAPISRTTTRATEPSSGGAEPAPSEVHDSTEPPVDVAPSSPRPASDGPTHVLVARLLRLDPKETVRAEVVVTAPGAAGVRGVAERDGEIHLDVSALFADSSPSVVEVAVDHPGYLPARVQASVPASSTRPVTIHVEIPLVPLGMLSGYVILDGDAASGNRGRGASVYLFTIEGEEPRGGTIATATCDPDGLYRMRAPERGRCAVVAVRGGYEPGFAVVSVEPDVETLAPPILVTRGASADGTVRFAGGAAIVGATVRATRIGDGRDMGSDLVWTDGRFVRGRLEASVQPVKEVFEMAGLEARPHRFEVTFLPDAHRSVYGGTSLTRDVEVPARGIVFSLDLARLDVRVGPHNSRAFGPAVSLDRESLNPAQKRSMRDFSALVLPEREHDLHVEWQGFEPVDRRVTSGKAGETTSEHVELKPLGNRGTLIVTLNASSGAVHQGAFRISKVGSTEAPTDCTPFAENGRFRFDDLESARYAVTAAAADSWGADREFSLPAATEVEVPASGTAEVTLKLEDGGRLRVSAVARGGRPLAATCVVRDREGRVVSIPPRTRRGVESRGRAATVEPTLDAVVPPGRYRIEVSHPGYAARTVEADVIARQCTELPVTLDLAR